MWKFRPPPHLMKHGPTCWGWGAALVLQGELSYAVLQELQSHCDAHMPWPPCQRTNKWFGPLFHLKAIAPLGHTAFENLHMLPSFDT